MLEFVCVVKSDKPSIININIISLYTVIISVAHRDGSWVGSVEYGIGLMKHGYCS